MIEQCWVTGLAAESFPVAVVVVGRTAALEVLRAVSDSKRGHADLVPTSEVNASSLDTSFDTKVVEFTTDSLVNSQTLNDSNSQLFYKIQ